ncbi:nuclear transport factor 2 family protein [Salinispora mooreana]|uniref:nuclear transport factor 2 family protein n=1 Tax=Salinispora mooreana TaxID=999545 RepID=UPI00035DBDB9|nr:nuclear transport factor 2 family protein [Salinispora mooreana]
MSDRQDVLDIVEQWRHAELAGDSAELAKLLADNFVGIGPLGWVRTKAQWLSKYRSGTVRNDAFELFDVRTLALGSSTLVVARQTQRGVNGTTDTSGEYRFSLTVSEGRICSIHVTRIIPAP